MLVNLFRLCMSYAKIGWPVFLGRQYDLTVFDGRGCGYLPVGS